VHIRSYLQLLQTRERQLAEALVAFADDHTDAPDVADACYRLAGWSQRHVEVLDRFVARWPAASAPEPAVPLPPLLPARIGGSYGLLHGLHTLWLLAQDVLLRWQVLEQVAWALRDGELLAACEEAGREAQRQVAWVRTRLAEVAAQAIVAAP